MTPRIKAAALAATLLAAPALADSPVPQNLDHSISIDASAGTVWDILSAPAAISDWHPDVVSVSIEGTGPGARRMTGLQSGTLAEDIDMIDADSRITRWRLAEENHDAAPVSFYINTVVVHDAGAGSRVTWRSSFFRADTTSQPAKQYDDKAALTFMDGFISDGLNGLKQRAESAD